MQDFSDWMTALQHEQRVNGSPASSYADTDSDSDSDCDDCVCTPLEAKRRQVAKQGVQRTAPICIPTNGRQGPHPHLCASPVESPDLSYHADMRLLRAGRYLHAHDEDELDEDDPAFYGNLAFFRSQYGERQPRLHKPSSKFAAAPASPTAVDDRDEDIFAMEL